MADQLVVWRQRGQTLYLHPCMIVIRETNTQLRLIANHLYDWNINHCNVKQKLKLTAMVYQTKQVERDKMSWFELIKGVIGPLPIHLE